MRTLCIDIGGTGIKGMVLDVEGKPLTDRERVRTPQPAVPIAVFGAIEEVTRRLGAFDRVSIGFPGVVVEGTTLTAPNLGDGWAGCKLVDEMSRRLDRPVRALNDADLQGLGVVDGRGMEILVTLGTGMGFGLYIDGRVVPNIEFGHHPLRKKKTYEERVSNAVMKKIGKRRWNRRVEQALTQLVPIFNYRKLYVGGGNARYLEPERLPRDTVIVDNAMGLRGGVRLWAAVR